MATFQSGTLATLSPGTDVASRVIITKEVQQFLRLASAPSAIVEALDVSKNTTVYTTAVAGVTQDLSAQGMRRFGLQVKQTGTVTSWSVVLEVSLDGVNFVMVVRHMKTADGTQTVEGDGQIGWSTEAPALYWRTRCEAITLGGGTSVTATGVALP